MCECLELVRCSGNKAWDRDVCNCECNLMCSDDETLDEGECVCRPIPTTEVPTRTIHIRGECTARASPNPRDDCTNYYTLRECRKHGCDWVRGQNRG